MPLRSLNYLSEETGFCRETCRKRLEGLHFERDGDHANAAKLYESKAALARLYFGGADPDDPDQTKPRRQMTPQLAAMELAVKRTEEIEVNIEIKRRERIPLEDIEAINEEALSNICGLLKANENKTLTAEVIGDMLANLREIGSKIREAGRCETV